MEKRARQADVFLLYLRIPLARKRDARRHRSRDLQLDDYASNVCKAGPFDN